MFNFIIQLLFLSSINSLSAGETLTEFHVIDTVPETLQDFPCPEAADIAPCVCLYDSTYGRLTLDCTEISSVEELSNILAKEFPVNDFYEFKMESSSVLTALNFACGGVTFRRFYLHWGPFPLIEVSDLFYESCSHVDLDHITFATTELSSLVFPPPPLSDKITYFSTPYCNLASVPAIRSDSLSYFYTGGAQISEIIPGTFDESPNLGYINLYANNIKVLKNGSFPIHSNGNFYDVVENGLETIEPGAFFLKGEPALNSLTIQLSWNLLKTIDASVFESLMPYITALKVNENPLDCGCDLAWIILNPEYLAKVTTDDVAPPSCADGTLLTDLDPTPYEQFC